MMDINMEIEMRGVAAFKEGDDDRIYLDDFDTFLERREVYYIYQAIPPIQADGGREVYGKDYANTNDIPDAMISSEFIENINNEFGREQRDKSSPDEIQDESMEDEQSMAKHRGEGMVKEIIDEIISVVGKKVKSTPDEIQRVGGDAEVEKSVGRGGKKVNKKKIHKNDKKVGVIGGENIVRNNNKGGVSCMGHCDKTFDNKWNMKRHLEAETKIKCDHCEKCLMGSRNLMSHMKRKHEEFLKKLGCETCDEKFVSEKSLNNHMKKHDPTIGEGKFQCDVCEKYFTNKFSLERHKKVIHKELILLNGGILVKVNTFLKDHTLVSSKGEVMEECEGDSEAFEFLKKIVNIE